LLDEPRCGVKVLQTFDNTDGAYAVRSDTLRSVNAPSLTTGEYQRRKEALTIMRAKQIKAGSVLTVEAARQAGFRPTVFSRDTEAEAVALAKQLTGNARGAHLFVVVRNGNDETRAQAGGHACSLWGRPTTK
jgi:hypothetical protein